MTNDDIEIENKRLLRDLHQQSISGPKQVEKKATPDVITVLRAMDEATVQRVASCHAPLFNFDCDERVLVKTYEMANVEDVNHHKLMFLANRWKLVAVDADAAAIMYQLSRAYIDVLKLATFDDLLVSASSGVSIYRFSATARYLALAAIKKDLKRHQRTELLLCTTTTLN